MHVLNKTIIIDALTSTKEQQVSNRKVKMFKVCKDANKKEIREALKQLFGDVGIHSIRTLRMPAKKVLFRGKKGIRPAYKKAYVVLNPGVDIKLK